MATLEGAQSTYTKYMRTILCYPDRKTELMNYVSLLLHMGNSNLPGPLTDLIEVSQQMACNSTGELDDTVVDDFLNNMNSIDYLLLCLCAIMSTKNDFINEKNQVRGEDSCRNAH